MRVAIEYIHTCQRTEHGLHQEMQRLQRESEYAREAHKENDMLKTEIQVMHQHLRRLDSNATHVYGHFTQQLNQQGPPQMSQQGPPQTNGGIALPPLNQPQAAQGPPPSAFGNGMQPPPQAMQGVEYGGYGR